MDDGEFGELTVGEMRALQTAQARIDALVRQIGHLELDKVRCLEAVREAERMSQSVLQGAAQRLQIAAGVVWHVTPEGKVREGDGQG